MILEAHAGGTGTQEFDIMLTERRGAAVRRLLIDAGVPADRISVLAKGALETPDLGRGGQPANATVRILFQ